MAIIAQIVLGGYEDSQQPTGSGKFAGPWYHAIWHPQMKKLVHEVVLVVEGPVASPNAMAKVHSCLQDATIASLVAAVSHSYATAHSLDAARSAWDGGHKQFIDCLGAQFSAHVDDQSHWEFRYV